MSALLLHGLGRGPSDWDGVPDAPGDVVVPWLAELRSLPTSGA